MVSASLGLLKGLKRFYMHTPMRLPWPVKAAISAGVLAFLLRRVDIHEIATVLEGLHPEATAMYTSWPFESDA